MKQADERSFNLLRAQMLLRAATGLERTGTHGGSAHKWHVAGFMGVGRR